MVRSIAAIGVLALVAGISGGGQPIIAEGIEIGLSFASQATLSWSQTAPLAFDDATFQLLVEVGSWVLQTSAGFSQLGFTAFDIKATGPIGSIDTSSSIGFDPSAAQFKYFQTSMRTSLLDVNLMNTFYIDRVQTASYDIISVASQVGAVAYDAALKLGLNPVEFQGFRMGEKWEWEPCGASLAANLYFTKSGFESIEINVSDVHLAERDCCTIEPILSVAARFTVDSKVISPKLSFKTEWPVCAEATLLAEVEVVDLLRIDGLSLHGLVVKSSLANGVSIGWSQAFSPASNQKVTGEEAFSNRFQISVPIMPCCGSPGSFDLVTYFGGDPASTGLFGWGKTTLTVNASMSAEVTVKLVMNFQVVSPQWALTLTVNTVW